jgi:hypothetical protein
MSAVARINSESGVQNRLIFQRETHGGRGQMIFDGPGCEDESQVSSDSLIIMLEESAQALLAKNVFGLVGIPLLGGWYSSAGGSMDSVQPAA